MYSRVRLLSLLAVPACLMLGSASVRGDPDFEIDPTGDPAIDVPAIQSAVDAGGIIQLGAGTFDFGDVGRVNITNSVTLVGEADRETIILGGNEPFRVADEHDAVFEDLWFQENLFSSIGMRDVSGDVTVKNCTFTSVRPSPWSGPWGIAAGIYIQGNEVGDLTVEDCYFDIFDNASLETTWILIGAPVWFFNVYPVNVGREMSVEVRDNEFVQRDSERAVCFWTVAGIDAVVEDNLFRQAQSNHNAYYFRHSLMMRNMGYPGDLKVRIVDNQFIGLPYPAYTAFWPEVIFEDNEVVLSPWDEKYTHLVNAETCFGLLQTDDAVLRNNRISGEGATAFKVEGSNPERTSSGNLLVENDIEGLCAYYTTVLMNEFTHDNTYQGSCRYGIMDLGFDNQIICTDEEGEPCSPGQRMPMPEIPTMPLVAAAEMPLGSLFDIEGGGAMAIIEVEEPGSRTSPPTTTQLMSVSPSPFQGSAVVRYELASAGDVSVRVFDVAGKVIRQLVNTSQIAGTYETAWDGRTDDGSRAAAGVYFVDLSAAGQPRLQQRIVLLE